MPLQIDPEENELRALLEVTSWERKRVLEIGCGEGRLTRRLARLGAAIDAIDPDPALIHKARESLLSRPARNIRYRTGHAERLFHADDKFDAVVFAWAL